MRNNKCLRVSLGKPGLSFFSVSPVWRGKNLNFEIIKLVTMVGIILMSVLFLYSLYVCVVNFKKRDAWTAWLSLGTALFCGGVLGLCIDEYCRGL